MKTGLLSYSPIMALGLLALPVTAWADHNPDFDDDAKPILRMQPGLVEYVESRFQVRDTGIAKIPGDDDRHAMPPYIFMAKPRGYRGDYYITLLIQPGSPGHILKVVDPTQPHGGAPTPHAAASAPKPVPTTPPPSTVTQQQVPPVPTQSTKQPAPPTADTPSGPITSGSTNPPSLEPPPDAPPSVH